MQKWEEWATFTSMLAVAGFVIINTGNYILMLIGLKHAGLFLPIKTIIIVGIMWWFLMTLINFYYERKSKGALGYLFSFISFSFVTAAIYWVFLKENMLALDDTSSFVKNTAIFGTFLYGSIALFVGVASFIYYAFYGAGLITTIKKRTRQPSFRLKKLVWPRAFRI